MSSYVRKHDVWLKSILSILSMISSLLKASAFDEMSSMKFMNSKYLYGDGDEYCT